MIDERHIFKQLRSAPTAGRDSEYYSLRQNKLDTLEAFSPSPNTAPSDGYIAEHNSSKNTTIYDYHDLALQHNERHLKEVIIMKIHLI